MPLPALAQAISRNAAERTAFAKSVAAKVEQARSLNAFTSCLTSEAIIEAIIRPAKGALAGIPFSVKDNILTEDFPTSIGTDILRAFNPGRDAQLVADLRAFGGVVIGKNNLPELCQSMTSNNPTFGPVRNPANHDWITGGSSGGCAAAVAAGLVPFALASDTGGSARIPAALCGCVGFRPTTGSYATNGFAPVSPTLDAPGLIASSSADVLWLHELIAGPAESTCKRPFNLSKLRVGTPQAHFFEDLAPVVSKRVGQALETARHAQVTLVRADIEEVAKLNAHVGFPIAFYEMLRETAIFLARERAGISVDQLIDGVKGLVERQALSSQLVEQPIDREAYVRALTENLPAYVAKIDAYMETHGLDAIAVPTTPLPAVAHKAVDCDGELTHNGKTVSTFLSYIRNTEPFSNYGGPCITIPIGRPGNCPVGLELVGRRGSDTALLALAAAMENVLRPQG